MMSDVIYEISMRCLEDEEQFIFEKSSHFVSKLYK